jgi:DNA-binding transcriptional ArsR family regulator
MSLEVDRATLELRALAHPLRLRMLSLLTGADLIAAEVARELATTHANASYHLRQLHAAGLIVIAGEERIRGGVAIRYRYEHPADLPPVKNDLPPSSQRRAGRASLYNALSAELRRRGAEFKPDGNRSHLTDAELWVDPEVWEQVRAQVHEASIRLHDAARPPRTPGTIRVNATMALFEMQPTTSSDDQSSDVAGPGILETDA